MWIGMLGMSWPAWMVSILALYSQKQLENYNAKQFQGCDCINFQHTCVALLSCS